MKIVLPFAIASMAFAATAHAQISEPEQIIVNGEVAVEKYNVPAPGIKIDVQVAGPVEQKFNLPYGVQQPSMPRQPLTDSTCASDYDFSAAEAEILRKNKVPSEPPVFTHVISSCYVSATAGTHYIYLPRTHMKGFSISVHMQITNPDGSVTDSVHSRLLHSNDLKTDPMINLPICKVEGEEPLNGTLNCISK